MATLQGMIDGGTRWTRHPRVARGVVRWPSRLPSRLPATLAVLLAIVLVAGAVAPTASAKRAGSDRPTSVIDWTVPPLTPDYDGDGVIDAYIDGNRTANVPRDGRYRVVLNGCGSQNATVYTWRVRPRQPGWKKPGPTWHRSKTIRTKHCTASLRLREGTYWVKLKTRGPGGTAVSHRRISVTAHIVVGLGDSYGSGSGAQVLTDAPSGLGYFDLTCERTPRANQALAALRLEESDPRSTVVFIHLACGGAQINPGLLAPARGNRPQVDEARDLLRGQRIDSLMLSIGGNDTGFGAIVQQCLLTGGIDCPTEPFAGSPSLHEFLMRQFDLLRNGNPGEPIDGLPVLAECLGGAGCTTSETPDGSGKPLRVKPRDVLYTTYPDLTRGDDGSYCDVVPGTNDPALANATEQEWAWIDSVAQAIDQDAVHTYTNVLGNEVELEQSSPGLNAVIAETRKRYGWSPVKGVYAGSFSDTRGHGYCASTYDPAADTGRWIFRLLASDEPSVSPPDLLVPLHPNAGGHDHYAQQIGRFLG